MQSPMTQWWAPVVDNDDFRVSYFYDYGIYAGFKGAKTLIKGCMNTGSSKMVERLASNWLQVLQRFVFFVAVLEDSWKISSEVKWVVIKFPVFFSEAIWINYHRGPSSLFMNTTSTDYSLSLIRLTTRFIWNLAMPFNLLERNRN